MENLKSRGLCFAALSDLKLSELKALRHVVYFCHFQFDRKGTALLSKTIQATSMLNARLSCIVIYDHYNHRWWKHRLVKGIVENLDLVIRV